MTSMVLCSSLILLMLERDKALLRTIMVGGVWNGFLLGRVRGQAVSCRFCGAPDNDGHLFWDCPFPPLVEVRENPEFHDLMRLDKARWPRCLLWHGWLPVLSGVNGPPPGLLMLLRVLLTWLRLRLVGILLVCLRDWVLSCEGDQWSVKFDVRDLGGHLDTTFRGWSSTLAARVRLVISRLALVFILPLDFHGRVRVVRSMFLPAALHGIEASLLASDSLRKLRSAVRRVVWSRRQPFATGCDPAFCVVWFRFWLLRRYLALWPAEVGRVYRLLELVGRWCPGHGPLHLLLASAAEIGFQWDPHALAWVRPGLPLLSNLAGPIQHFRAAILDAWRNKVAADLCRRKGFRGGPLLDVHVFVKGIRHCFVPLWLVVSGTVFFLVVFVVSLFHVGFVGLLIMMVICSGNVPFLLSLRSVKILSFTIL